MNLQQKSTGLSKNQEEFWTEVWGSKEQNQTDLEDNKSTNKLCRVLYVHKIMFVSRTSDKDRRKQYTKHRSTFACVVILI